MRRIAETKLPRYQLSRGQAGVCDLGGHALPALVLMTTGGCSSNGGAIPMGSTLASDLSSRRSALKISLVLRRFATAIATIWLSVLATSHARSDTPTDGSVLPFPVPPSKSVAGPTLQDSKLVPFPTINHLSKDAPNILIVLLDDAMNRNVLRPSQPSWPSLPPRIWPKPRF